MTAGSRSSLTSRFLCMEGMDGAGKSTQLSLLEDWLRGRGEKVTICRDPGGTAVSEQIRQLLLSPPTGTEISFRTEMLLYMASRAQLVDDVIRPALERGEVVLCDRYLLSTVVYQGYAGGLDPEMIWRVGAEAADGSPAGSVFWTYLRRSRSLEGTGRPTGSNNDRWSTIERFARDIRESRLAIRTGFI